MMSQLLVSVLVLAAPMAEAEVSAAPAQAAASEVRRISLGVEALGGVMLFSSLNPYSFGLQPGWSFGACADLNFGQVLPIGSWGLELMSELRWQYSKHARGTHTFSLETHHQAVTLAPGLALRLGTGSPWLLFAEVGAGAEVVTVQAARGESASGALAGVQGLIQYGGGLRFAPRRTGVLGLTLRLEVMRVHRDPQGDTWVGLGAGVRF